MFISFAIVYILHSIENKNDFKSISIKFQVDVNFDGVETNNQHNGIDNAM